MMHDLDSESNSRGNVITQTWKHFQQVRYIGVLQGSILSPLLFLCYIKGLPQILPGNNSNKIYIYPDDANLKRYQKLLDDVTPFLIGRWIAVAVLTVAFLARIFILQGWYIVTYALGIYHLNLFIAFLSPKIDPEVVDYEDDGPELPTRANEEFRPFIRRLPEFKFWYSVTKSTVIATICTFFDCFNIPVFWPILVMYFITLFGITMKRQIKHMIKYRYLPFTHGKPKYRGHEDSGKVINAK